MAIWQTLLSRATSVAIEGMLRIYGAFFLVLGVLFLYWSGRGFLGYAHGIREAWADPTACVIGLIIGPLSLWAGFHAARSPARLLSRLSEPKTELDRTIQEAMKLEQTDPAASRQLLDDYFAREAAATETRRTELRGRAPKDISAALALREELSTELRDNALMRKDVLRKWPAEKRSDMLLELDAADSRLQTELSELASTIDRLRPH